MKNIIIGSRGSKLALVQAEQVRDILMRHHPQMNFDIKVIKTMGDKILDAPLSKIGDKGLFTREIEEELLSGTIDLAVHSMKDMPTRLPDGLCISAVTERLDARDVFISKNNKKLSDLKPGDTIATGSLRRRAQLLAFCPGLNIADMRGNIITRMEKLHRDPRILGIVLAYAGVSRLNMLHVVSEIIDPEIIIPPVGQAALAIETRDGDTLINDIVSVIHHRDTARAVLCERAFLAELEGGCQVPAAAHAEIHGREIRLTGLIASLDGAITYRNTVSGQVEDYIKTGKDLARELLNAGGKKILDEIYSSGTRDGIPRSSEK